MCGIAGIISPKVNHYRELFQTMLLTQKNRGPDSQGEWFDSDRGICLGHQRLAIQDLSVQGHQPMHSQCRRYVISYNGEVYNCTELKQSLKRYTFKGHSDTEVILAYIAEHGLEKTVNHLVGMFAFALFDLEKNTLSLVRDRIGIKPLYYTQIGSECFFASQLNALMLIPQLKKNINLAALPLYLRHNYIPAPHTIIDNVFKLEAGHVISFDLSTAQLESKKPYWSLSDFIYPTETFNDFEEASGSFHQALKDAVTMRLVSDVPIGCFLSGGYDSTLVAALMQANSSSAINTFSIGFSEPSYNEAPYAKQVAEVLGTAHQELYVNDHDLFSVIPELANIYDEPFADSSQIPTYLVSKMARSQVTVCLSGDGGDELFGGYHRYIFLEKIRQIQSKIPRSVQFALQSLIHALPEEQWDHIYAYTRWLLPKRYRFNLMANKLYKLATLLKHDNLPAQYHSLVSVIQDPFSYLQIPANVEKLSVKQTVARSLSDMNYMQYSDYMTYLPDDILTKVDRASMAVSLEVRVPLIDHRLIEQSWRLPESFKVKDGKGKRLLRHIVHQYVPESIMDRPKMGFGIPLAEWLRTSLKPWASDYLSESMLSRQAFYNIDQVSLMWKKHLAREGNYEHQLWSILMLQACLEKYGIAL